MFDERKSPSHSLTVQIGQLQPLFQKPAPNHGCKLLGHHGSHSEVRFQNEVFLGLAWLNSCTPTSRGRHQVQEFFRRRFTPHAVIHQSSPDSGLDPLCQVRLY
jgi:hypothetical protein